MKKILVCVIWLFFITGMNLSNSIEYNINVEPYDSSFTIMENADFDENLVNYIEEHDILIYYQEHWPSPFLMYNKEPESKTTEINGGSTNVYDKLLSEQNSGTYYLSFENSDITMNEFSVFLTANYEIDVYFSDDFPTYKMQLNFNIIAVILLLVVLLIIIVDYVKKNKNTIYVAKVNGKSNKSILLLFIMDLKIPLILSILINVASYFIFAPYYSYFNLLVATILIVSIVLFVLGVTVIIYFIQHRQNNKGINFPQIFLYFANLIFITLLLTQGMDAFRGFTSTLVPVINLKINEEYYSQFYTANGQTFSMYIDTMSDEFLARGNEYKKVLYDLGAFYFVYDQDENEINADENYLKNIGYDELSSYDAIVPVERKEEFLAKDCFCDKSNTYYYEQDIKLESPDPYYFTINNPIINVSHEQNLIADFFYVSVKMSFEEFNALVDDLYIDSTNEQGMILFDYDDTYEYQLDRFLERIDDFVMYFILYFIVIIILTMLIIRRFFEINKEEIIVKRVNGQSFNKQLIQNLVIVNLIVIIICNFKVVEPLSYIFIVVLNIITIVLYKIIEKSFRRLYD